jgi:hypothetical protein
MQRTITLHLPAERSLVKTIEAVNMVTNDIMALVFAPMSSTRPSCII